MPPVAISLRVQGGAALRDLQRQLREQQAGDLQRRLNRKIRVAARPVIADLRRAILSVEVSSSRGGVARPDRDTQLRQRIAGALTVAITRKGVRIKVSARKVGAYGATLPKYLDTEIRTYARWRHPVFGRRTDAWVEQRGQPWFFETVNRHSTDFRRAVLEAVDEVARELANRGT